MYYIIIIYYFLRISICYLGSINSYPSNVVKKPFSSSVLRFFFLVFATTTKICTRVSSYVILITSSSLQFTLYHFLTLSILFNIKVEYQFQEIKMPSIFRNHSFDR